MVSQRCHKFKARKRSSKVCNRAIWTYTGGTIKTVAIRKAEQIPPE